MMADWVLVELGGSSCQSAVERDGQWHFSPGVVRRPGAAYALAVPGVIQAPNVLYATNLGWPDIADPAHELGLDGVDVLANDAVAAGLGESALRRDAQSGALPDLLYVSLGTGVGTALVLGGEAYDADMSHLHVGGTRYCDGCRSTGCLNSEIEAKRLSRPLAAADAAKIADTLAAGIHGLRGRTAVPGLLVVAGGVPRANPAVMDRINETVTECDIEGTFAPEQAKSAAYAGLRELASAGWR